jgi:hypothetical protein
MRRYWLMMGWALAAVLPGPANAGDYLLKGINGPNTLQGDYYLGMVKGHVRLVQMSDAYVNWEFDRSAAETRIRMEKGGKYGGWYLCYDIKGKSKEVFLSKKPTAGSTWGVGDNRSLKNLRYTYFFVAAAGKLQGCYLGAGPKAEKLKDRKRQTFQAYKAFLLKNPKKVPRYSVYTISP